MSTMCAWIKKYGTFTMEYYSVVFKKLEFAGKWMELKNNILSEIFRIFEKYVFSGCLVVPSGEFSKPTNRSIVNKESNIRVFPDVP